MSILSNILSFNNAKPDMPRFILERGLYNRILASSSFSKILPTNAIIFKPDMPRFILERGLYNRILASSSFNKILPTTAIIFKPDMPRFILERGLYNRILASSSFSKILPTNAIIFKPDTRVLAQPKPAATLIGSRFSYVYPISPIEREQSNQVETLISRVTKLNLPTITSLDEISSMGPILEAVHEEVETPPISLNLVGIITREFDLQALLSNPSTNTASRNNPSKQLPIQSSREKNLIRWILTSHDVCRLAVTVLHNFFDICCQKPEERNFINESLVPRIRYAGFTFSATAGVVYHVAIGILFTPLVAATLGQKKEINEIWYSYWAGASISAMGIFAGIFGMVSGNYLIHKTMEKSIPQFKRLLTRYLWRVQKICMRLNGVDFPQLRQEVKNVKTTAEMVFVTRKLVGIAKKSILVPIQTASLMGFKSTT
ncbi:hypothetical protein RHOW815_001318 [Candidatus Rhabdochlamydia sp. W815]|nr:hypothetical protein RHOW815_001318 [Candidatus Rhabdochlamydia sp. W815]